jgi:hypothetical protein
MRFLGRTRGRRQARKVVASVAAKQAFVEALDELGYREHLSEAEQFLVTRPVSDPGAFGWLLVANPLWRWEYQLSWILGLGGGSDPESARASPDERAEVADGLWRRAVEITDVAAKRRQQIESGARPLDPDRVEHEKKLQARSTNRKVLSVDEHGARAVLWPEYVFAHLDGLGLHEQARRAAEKLAGYDLIDVDVWTGTSSTSDRLCAAVGIGAETRRFLRRIEVLDETR